MHVFKSITGNWAVETKDGLTGVLFNSTSKIIIPWTRGKEKRLTSRKFENIVTGKLEVLYAERHPVKLEMPEDNPRMRRIRVIFGEDLEEIQEFLEWDMPEQIALRR